MFENHLYLDRFAIVEILQVKGQSRNKTKSWPRQAERSGHILFQPPLFKIPNGRLIMLGTNSVGLGSEI